MLVVKNPDLKDTPARVDLDSGVIQVNPVVWPTLPKSYRKFILKHEEGHFVLGTFNETAADDYAFNEILRDGSGNLKKIAIRMQKDLPSNQDFRAHRIMLKALKHNWQKTGTEASRREYNNYKLLWPQYANFTGTRSTKTVLILAAILAALLIYALKK